MNTTAGWGVAGANSVELASFIPSTLRANSMTATCATTTATTPSPLMNWFHYMPLACIPSLQTAVLASVLLAWAPA
jgi:hypothetical protein